MKKVSWIIILWLSGALALAGFENHSQPDAEQLVTQQYRSDLNRLTAEVAALTRLVQAGAPDAQLRQQFHKARHAYKKTEWLAEYFDALTARAINGPNLPEIEPEAGARVKDPQGFQVIEELLFPARGKVATAAVLAQCRLLQRTTTRLQDNATTLQTTGAQVFDALRLEVFRLVSLGITGFDSPVALNSLPEAAASLEALQKAYSCYASAVREANPRLDERLQTLFRQAQQRLGGSFDRFNRLQFLTDFLNPLSEQLLLAQQQLQLPVLQEPRVIRTGATTLFASGAINPDYFVPDLSAGTTPEKSALGKQLFFEGGLSGDGRRSCATCHQPQKAFTDGLATSLSVHGKSGKRNAPTLVNASLQPNFFWDNRVSFLEDQIQAVITNKDEMDGSLEKAVRFLNKNEVYRQQFQTAYGDTVTEYSLSNAIASYLRSLNALDSRFDQYMRGDRSALNPQEIEGFNLFAGKAKCATCHFMPLFNGSTPPSSDKSEVEVLGVPATPDTLHPRLDADEGRFNVFGAELQRHAFKTPTLRNIALTAPYMHNGVYRTLEEVVDFYNRGGGAGLGLKVDNQTLPRSPLHLSALEKQALVAFLKTLTDTSYQH
ncbi:cytochrome c peroxidase [Paraflavisolibacter sp. H34]|uniref:cytochrome c peroxidase n=1 Tax=Huijunlia imazamoxiresistens TaxID=3127457 RepID=UPI00301A9F86